MPKALPDLLSSNFFELPEFITVHPKRDRDENWKQFLSANVSTSQQRLGLLRFFMRKSEMLIFLSKNVFALSDFFLHDWMQILMSGVCCFCCIYADCTSWCLWTIDCGELYLCGALLCNRVPSWNSVNSEKVYNLVLGSHICMDNDRLREKRKLIATLCSANIRRERIDTKYLPQDHKTILIGSINKQFLWFFRIRLFGSVVFKTAVKCAR